MNLRAIAKALAPWVIAALIAVCMSVVHDTDACHRSVKPATNCAR